MLASLVHSIQYRLGVKKIDPSFFDIFTHMTHEEKLKLFELGLKKKNGTIVEIGSYLGASAMFLGAAAKLKKHHLFCVDTWENQSMSEGFRDTFSEFSANTKPLNNLITPKRGFSSEVSKTFNTKIDIIFFDGDHSYDAIKSDWESWKSKLNSNAIVIFHDYGWAEGVQRVVNEDVSHVTTNHENLPNMWWAILK